VHGCALVAMDVAREVRTVVPTREALLLFNFLAVIFLAIFGNNGRLAGVLLWFTMVRHLVLTRILL
jgi:hypothetical protein